MLEEHCVTNQVSWQQVCNMTRSKGHFGEAEVHTCTKKIYGTFSE